MRVPAPSVPKPLTADDVLECKRKVDEFTAQFPVTLELPPLEIPFKETPAERAIKWALRFGFGPWVQARSPWFIMGCDFGPREPVVVTAEAKPPTPAQWRALLHLIRTYDPAKDPAIHKIVLEHAWLRRYRRRAMRARARSQRNTRRRNAGN